MTFTTFKGATLPLTLALHKRARGLVVVQTEGCCVRDAEAFEIVERTDPVKDDLEEGVSDQLTKESRSLEGISAFRPAAVDLSPGAGEGASAAGV